LALSFGWPFLKAVFAVVTFAALVFVVMIRAMIFADGTGTIRRRYRAFDAADSTSEIHLPIPLVILAEIGDGSANAAPCAD
jgi:hypothetical protein